MSALSALLQVKTDTESVDHIRKMKAGCVSLDHLLSPTYQTGEGFRQPRLFCSPHCPSSCLWDRLPHSSYMSCFPRSFVCFHYTLMSLEIPISLNKYEHSLVFMSISLPSLHSVRASLVGDYLWFCVHQDTFLSLAEGSLISFSSFFPHFLSYKKKKKAHIGLKLTT